MYAIPPYIYLVQGGVPLQCGPTSGPPVEA